jgi:hypothetical protein
LYLLSFIEIKHEYMDFQQHSEELAMNKKTCLAFVLAASIGVIASPVWAEVVPAPEQHPANIKAPAVTTEDHTAAAALHKEHAEHHQATAEHHKSIAADYEKAGHKDLAKHHQELAKHHEALATEHEKTAATHEAKAAAAKK